MSQPAPGQRDAGRRFGPYRLDRLLGSGGFGEVYVAEDTEKRRVVALKLIAAPYSQDPSFRERLYREANAAGQLHDPHVVPIHSFGEIDGQLYIDMRLIDGSDLQAVLAGVGALQPRAAVDIARQIASALDAAHDAGIVHRDVKPANVLLTADNFVCLVDFGLASAASETRITGTGTTIGTLAYMAPERFGTGAVDASADVYALACVLYECLTGEAPYPAASDLPGLLGAHLYAPIPRPSRQQQIPGGLDAVIARGMAKSPADRYRTAGELARAASQALVAGDHETALAPTQLAPELRPDRPGSRRVRLIALAVAVAVGIVAVGVVVLNRGASPPARTTRPAATVADTRQTQQPNPRQSVLPFPKIDPLKGVAVDPAGNVYAVAQTRIDLHSQLLRLSPGATATTVVNVATTSSMFSRIAVDAAGTLYLADYGGKFITKVAAGTNAATVIPTAGFEDAASALATSAAGDIYAVDGYRAVMKLASGSSVWAKLPFTGLGSVDGVAADAAGNVYVADVADRQILELAAGSTTPVELPSGGIRAPRAIAVDAAGVLYIAEDFGQAWKLAVGAANPTQLSFTGLGAPWGGVGVDAAGNVYVADADGDRIVKLAAE